MRRLLSLAPALAVVACLAVLPACGKKAPPAGPNPAPAPGPSGGPGGDPTPGGSGGAASSEYAVFAQVNAKDVFAGELFAEVMKAVGAGDAAKMKADLEKQGQEVIGVKPTELASVTVCMTEMPERGEPKMVVIVTANTPIDKTALLKTAGSALEPDARGFYKGRSPALAHFVDDKTAAMVHPDLADKYLAGFAKNRTGWPFTADLITAAGHTLYVQVQGDKLPTSMRSAPEVQMAGPLLAAKSAVLTLDLKGKTLALNARLAFPDADAAGKAKGLVAPLLGFATMAVDGAATGKDAASLGEMLPAVKAAQKTLKEAKLDAAGSDLTLSASYTADFDVGQIVAGAAKKVQEAAGRTTASNNLKQIGLALHNISAAAGVMPVHAVGKGGVALKDEKDKPLLSWRVALLPYLEEDALYRQFKLDEPWDSENNKKLIDKMPKIFAPASGKTGKPGHTHLQMVIGATALKPVGARLPGSFPDGTSNTVAVVEAAEPVIWTKPDDVMLPGKELPKGLKKKFGGQFPGGFLVLLWDGSVRFVSDAVSDRTLEAAITPAGGEVLGKDW